MSWCDVVLLSDDYGVSCIELAFGSAFTCSVG